MIEVFMEMNCTVVGASHATRTASARPSRAIRHPDLPKDPARSSFGTGPFGGYLKKAVSSEVRGKAGPCKHDIYWGFLSKKKSLV